MSSNPSDANRKRLRVNSDTATNEPNTKEKPLTKQLRRKKLLSACFKQLECGICLELLNHPIVLPCKHTFCSDCVEKPATSGKSAKKLLHCPDCKAECTAQQVVSAAINVNRLLELFKGYEEEDGDDSDNGDNDDSDDSDDGDDGDDGASVSSGNSESNGSDESESDSDTSGDSGSGSGSVESICGIQNDEDENDGVNELISLEESESVESVTSVKSPRSNTE